MRRLFPLALVLAVGCDPSTAPTPTPDTEFRAIELPDLCGCDSEGCTLTQGYWKNHEAAWQGLSPDDQWCGQSLADIFDTPVAGDGWYALAHQTIAAILNINAGACPSQEVAEALVAAQVLLSQCMELAPAITSPLVEILTDFNEGSAGTPSCED